MSSEPGWIRITEPCAARVLSRQQRIFRKVDFAARYGGDEFVILLPETSKEQATTIARRIRAAIEDHIFLKDKGMKVRFTASFGVATFPEDAKTKDDLIKMSDERMYKVKNSTRNSVICD